MLEILKDRLPVPQRALKEIDSLVKWQSKVSKILRQHKLITPYDDNPSGKNLGTQREEDLHNDAKQTGLTPHDAMLLLAFLLNKSHTRETVNYLEIGVFRGATMSFLMKYSERAHFTGVDLFEDFEFSDDNTHISQTVNRDQVEQKLSALGQVQLRKGRSVDVLEQLHEESKKYDVILVDANHTYDAAKEDFEAAEKVLAEEGYMAFDNASASYYPDHKYILRDGGPWKLCLELVESGRYRLIDSGCRLKVLRKIKSI